MCVCVCVGVCVCVCDLGLSAQGPQGESPEGQKEKERRKEAGVGLPPPQPSEQMSQAVEQAPVDGNQAEARMKKARQKKRGKADAPNPRDIDPENRRGCEDLFSVTDGLIDKTAKASGSVFLHLMEHVKGDLEIDQTQGERPGG